MKDSLGDRIKSQYEDRTRMFIPRRTYTIIRVDGKAFHTLTRGFNKPFDYRLMEMMDETAIAMCKEIQGAKFAYTQSDEISILLTDFEKITTSAWFDGNIQKMVSIASACATANFNMQMLKRGLQNKMAMFDARVFTIPDPVEVENYFIWRQQDATRNSVQMAARSVYSHKECDNKNIPALHDLLHAKGINWNNYYSGEKRGRCIVKHQVDKSLDYTGYQAGQIKGPENVIRNEWTCLDGRKMSPGSPEHPATSTNETPIFTQDRKFLRDMIPPITEFVLAPVETT
jgi:tRNA(His) guanylyltransferase